MGFTYSGSDYSEETLMYFLLPKFLNGTSPPLCQKEAHSVSKNFWMLKEQSVKIGSVEWGAHEMEIGKGL